VNSEDLKRAASGGNLEKVKALLIAGANVNFRGRHNETALHDAAQYGHYDIVVELLNAKADVNARGWSNWTPLHYAAKRHYQIVKLLLAHGADVNAMGGGDTPLNLALVNDKRDIAALLREYGGQR